MIYKTCSSNRVIAKVFRDMKPSNSGWAGDAIEWIGEAISIMGAYQGLKDIPLVVEVIDYRAKIPCDLEMLLGIEYNNMRLQRSGGINHKNRCSCLENLVCCTDESYSLNPNYIHTTFKEGCITIYYRGVEVDCDGYPTVIDDAFYQEALFWYIVMRMILRGNKHPIITYELASMNWEKYYPRAQNRCKMPDIDGYEVFKKSWLGLARSTNMTNEFFNTVVAGENPSTSAEPGTLVT